MLNGGFYCLFNTTISISHAVRTALQAGRSRVRFPMGSLKFLIDLILPVALCPWCRLSLLTEINIGDIPWDKVKAAAV
jgi:hypothetical protein